MVDGIEENNQREIVAEYKSTGVAVLLSVFIVGLGFFYIDDIERFLVYMISYYVIVGVMFFCGVPILSLILLFYCIIFYIFQLFRIYKETKRFNYALMMKFMSV